MKSFKVTFLKGLVFFIPAVFTGWVLYRILRIFYGIVSMGTQFLPLAYKEYALTRFIVEAAIVIGTLFFIVISGIMAETFLGRFVRKMVDHFLGAIPFVNSLYDVLKQIFNILFLKSDQLLARPVLVPFPHPGKFAVGFITGQAEPKLKEMSSGEFVKVFLPTVPFPTTGFFLIFPREQVVESALSTEEALRLVLSGGLLEEKDLPVEGRKKPEDEGVQNNGFLRHLRTHFFNGLLFLFPAFITLNVAFRVFRFFYSLMSFGAAVIPEKYGHLPYLDHLITVATIIFNIFFVWFIGLMVTTYIGKFIRGHLHNLITGIPFAGSIFRALRQMMDFAFSDTPPAFSRVVLINFPHKECKSIGFITGTASQELTARGFKEGEEIYKVFVPGTPNPTSGFLLLVPKNDVIMTNLTVEEGLFSVVSGGMLKQTDKSDKK
jgi:uncharacterized membrane protein